MYSKKLEWKEHSLNLEMVEDWLRTNTTGYVGNSADSSLTLWFESEPSQEELDAIDSYWTSLDENSNEALEYVSLADIEQRISELKIGMLAKTWDAMSTAERKIMLGQTPTKAELWP